MTEPIEEAIKASYLNGAMDAIKTSVILEENIYEMSMDNPPPESAKDRYGKILVYEAVTGWHCIPWEDTFPILASLNCTHYTFTPEPPTPPAFSSPVKEDQ